MIDQGFHSKVIIRHVRRLGKWLARSPVIVGIQGFHSKVILRHVRRLGEWLARSPAIVGLQGFHSKVILRHVRRLGEWLERSPAIAGLQGFYSKVILRHVRRLGEWLARPPVIVGIVTAAFLAQALVVAFHQGAIQGERDMRQVFEAALDEERFGLAALSRESQVHIDTLSSQVARLQSHIKRLDALGGTLMDFAQLEEEAGTEFDFGTEPGLGGRVAAYEGTALSATDLGGQLDRLNQQIEDRSLSLAILEDVLQRRRLVREVYPSNWPVRSGWISSHFGKRRDPFHGRPAWHAGVDFSAVKGTKIHAAASGIVEFSGNRYGYGLTVQIRHGNGYQTRYGHANKLLVEPGQMVEQGEAIALVGSTGRSTGPHLHFEVLKNGRAINPMKFLSTRRN